MAINYGNTIIEGGIEPSVAVQAPVQDDSGAVLANGLAPVFETVGKIAGSIFQQNQENANGEVLISYENELLDLADAVDQGMDKDEALLHARAVRRSYLSNAPGLQTEFDKIWSSTVNATGLGNVIIQGTVEQQAQEARTTEAIKLGYTPQEYELVQARAQQLEAMTNEVGVLEAAGKIPTLQQKNRYINGFIGLADAAFPAAQTQINNAMGRIAANPELKGDIAAELNLQLGQSIEQLRGAAGPMESAWVTTPIEGLLKTFNDWTNDTVSTAVLENEIKTTKLKYEAMYVNDPTLGPVIAASAILGDLGLANTSVANALFSPEVLQRLKEVGEGKPVNVVSGGDGDILFTEAMRQVAGTITADSPPELIDEVMSSLNSMVDGAYTFERQASEDGLGYKGLVETLGSKEAGNAIAIGGGISAQHADKFTGVLKENYEQVLLPAISQFWEETDVSSMEDIRFTETGTTQERLTGTVSEFLEPVWNGSIVEFVPKAGFEDNAQVISLADEVNTGDSSIGIPLNNLINAYANVSGNDAKGIWEQDFAGRLFGIGEDGEVMTQTDVKPATEPTEEQVSSNLSLADFQPKTGEEIEEFMKQNSAIVEQAQLPPIDPEYATIEGVDYSSYLPNIRAAESGGNDSAKNPTSTATGRYQFLRSTWNDLVNRYPEAGLTVDGRTDPTQQEAAIRLFTSENARYLKGRGIPLNNGNLYAAHFLGASDAVKVLGASEGLVSDYVPASVVKANRFLRGMTVAQFKAWSSGKGNG